METEKCKIDNFKDAEIKIFIGYSEDKNQQIAKFFESDNVPKTNRYVSKIKVFTYSEIETCEFEIKLCLSDENGGLGARINHEEILVQALEGKNWTTIDVSEHHIKFPKQGLFIVLKWLKTEENYYEYDGHKKDREKRYTYPTYAPQFGTLPSESDFLWIYENETWKKAVKNKLSILKQYEGMNTVPAIELEFESLQT
jgi:hypothetical protein